MATRDDARYIWTDDHGVGRNRYVLFRHAFALGGAPARGEICLFADTRYRLIVNGVVLGHGPARFYASKPEYDRIDIASALQEGENVIAVMVNSAGVTTFHSEASIGGLIAWGSVRDVDGKSVEFATGPGWKAMESPGHGPGTHFMSFALNPAEQLDLGAMPQGWDEPGFDDAGWAAAVEISEPGRWGEPAERTIPLLDEREVFAARRAGTWAARPAEDEEIYGFRLVTASGRGHHTEGRVGCLTYVHSPRRQTVRLGAFWGKYWLNGEELRPENREDVARRQDLPCGLEEGWNSLFILEKLGGDWWELQLGLPREAGLTLSAEKRRDSENVFLLGGPWPLEDAELDGLLPIVEAGSLPERLGPWKPWARKRRAHLPVFERAWRRFDPLEGGEAIDTRGAEYAGAVGEGDALALLFDFEGEMLGRAVLDISAAPGTIIDVGYAERLTPAGTADLHGRYKVDMIERYVTAGGLQRIQAFHPRGWRWLEVLARGDVSPFEVHRVGMTRANYPVQEIGSFACSDPVLNDVWKLGRATQFACMEDAYLDCPWRERGLYSGDFLVQFYTNLAAYGDVALFRRCIELFLLGQGENGLVRPGAHGLPPGRHPDYSAILVQCLWHYYARSGDVEFPRAMLPRLRRLLAGLETFELPGECVVTDGNMHPYVDLSRVERNGASCALNCFFQRAWHDGARLLALLGEADLARRYAEKAERLTAAIREGFWDEGRGLFNDHRAADLPETTPSVPSNTLAILYDIASEQQQARAIDWLAERMLNNFRTPEPERNDECNVTSYFSFYAIGALYKHGKDVEAEQFMRRYWGRMLDSGAWTCWEFMLDGASRCHAWSSSPTHYLSTQVLGVQPARDGEPDVIRIEPQAGSLAWAEGIYPHARGGVWVSWRRVGDVMHLEYSAPDGVEVEG